jgi:signal peptidase I
MVTTSSLHIPDPETVSRGRANPRPLRHPRSRALGVALAALSGVLVVAAVALVVAWKVGGLVPLVVTSGSMSPGMPAGSLLFVREVPDTAVRVGDVITFDAPGAAGRVTHRVIERIERGGRPYFRTQGDANEQPDNWYVAAAGAGGEGRFQPGFTYSSGKAVRRVAHIPLAGRLFAVTVRPHVRAVLLWSALGLVGLNILALLWLAPARRARSHRWQSPEAAMEELVVLWSADPLWAGEEARSHDAQAA